MYIHVVHLYIHPASSAIIRIHVSHHHQHSYNKNGNILVMPLCSLRISATPSFWACLLAAVLNSYQTEENLQPKIPPNTAQHRLHKLCGARMDCEIDSRFVSMIPCVIQNFAVLPLNYYSQVLTKERKYPDKWRQLGPRSEITAIPFSLGCGRLRG